MKAGNRTLGTRLRVVLESEIALVLDPEVLFLDEPFAALDQPTRRRLSRELGELLRARRMATVFVTHDIAEASALCDRCTIIDAGALLQEGPMAELIERPRSPRVAEVLGSLEPPDQDTIVRRGAE